MARSLRIDRAGRLEQHTLNAAGQAPPAGARAPDMTAGPAAQRSTAHRREQAAVITAVAVLVIAAWTYLVLEAGRMHAPPGAADAMPGMDMAAMAAMSAAVATPQAGAWSPAAVLLLFVMWAVMMVAMMLPSATPMIALFAGVSRGRRARGQAWVPTAVFVGGYLLLWTAFAAVAALAQWGLHRTALLSPMMVAASPLLGGSLLLAAGIYQFTPLKRACLSRCRSPLAFLSAHWREGARGALRLGMLHGAYCIGCCAVLMSLLFVAGVMNLLWIAALSAFVLLEKLLPRGEWLGRAAGVLLIGWGVWLLRFGLA